MSNRTFYNEILTDHNLNPIHKEKIDNANIVLEGVNPSCGDDIWLQLKLDGDKIIDGAFYGDGCAISQASTDIMLDLIIGKTKEEALELIELFMKMIKESITCEQKELLEEAVCLEEIHNMPSRVKCAVLGWRTLEEGLQNKK